MLHSWTITGQVRIPRSTTTRTIAWQLRLSIFEARYVLIRISYLVVMLAGCCSMSAREPTAAFHRRKPYLGQPPLLESINGVITWWRVVRRNWICGIFRKIHERARTWEVFMSV